MKFSTDPNSIKKAHLYLDTFAGKDEMLNIDSEQPKRKLSANNLMWLWFDVLAKEMTELGYKHTKEFWYYSFMQLYPTFRNIEGEVFQITSSMFNKSEMHEFMSAIEIHCNTEFGVELPTISKENMKNLLDYYNKFM